jgi:hypothetical protein
MKFFKHIPKSLTALALVLTASSCSLFDLDVNKDPNNPLTVNPDLLLSRIESDIAFNMADLDTSLETFMGLVGTQGTSRFDLKNTSFDDFWSNMYTGPIKDIDGMIASATSSNSAQYIGVGQILKAYVYASMVDMYGDVPFSEAGLGDARTPNKAPKFDKDAVVYTECIKLIDNGIANIAKTTGLRVGATDIIYGGDMTKWGAFAKSLKLKLLMTSRKGVTGSDKTIKDLITAGGFITAAQDFQFIFSKDATSIRHPWYTGAYTGLEFDASYITNQLMSEMYCDGDPRFPFYFKRQTTTGLDPANPADVGTIPSGYLYASKAFWKQCFADKGKKQTKTDSTIVKGMFGRERADPTGIPLDGSLRMLPGVYPCGGFSDARAPAVPGANAAPSGGIHPMLTSINILYYQIEAVLELGATGDARKLFEQAMRDHITKVVNFGATTDLSSVRPAATVVDDYVNLWLKRYDGASTNTSKLDVCMKQFWFTSFGSGAELYNAHRRLGLPTSIASPYTPTSRKFPLRLPYAQSELDLNPNAAAYKTVVFDKDPIFWNK